MTLKVIHYSYKLREIKYDLGYHLLLAVKMLMNRSIYHRFLAYWGRRKGNNAKSNDFTLARDVKSTVYQRAYRSTHL